MATTWTLDGADGELHVLTGVAGRAARMGHRLTILVAAWSAAVDVEDGRPVAVRLTADVGSLTVRRGEGGVTPLSAPEKALARSNALKTLSAERFPTVTFETDAVEPDGDGYLLTGTLEIRGRRRRHALKVDVDDRGAALHLSARSEVHQSEFGVKPYSMFMGAMKVEDVVTVTFSAVMPKTGT